ncbi:MAG: hypothetical protein RL701_3954 [Pseudomonadota bacterium]|jgi:hypothetical protein
MQLNDAELVALAHRGADKLGCPLAVLLPLMAAVAGGVYSGTVGLVVGVAAALGICGLRHAIWRTSARARAARQAETEYVRRYELRNFAVHEPEARERLRTTPELQLIAVCETWSRPGGTHTLMRLELATELTVQLWSSPSWQQITSTRELPTLVATHEPLPLMAAESKAIRELLQQAAATPTGPKALYLFDGTPTKLLFVARDQPTIYTHFNAAGVTAQEQHPHIQLLTWLTHRLTAIQRGRQAKNT